MKTNDERTKFEALMKAGGLSVTMYGNVYVDETVQRARSIWCSLMPDQRAGDATPIGYVDLNARSASTAFAWAKYTGPAGNKTMPVYASPPINCRDEAEYRDNFPQEFWDDNQLLHDYIAYANAPDSGFPDESLRLQKLNERAKAMGLNPPKPEGSVT